MKLIGLAGRARSGKSSIARHLREEYGYHELAFADPIRDILEYVFNVPRKYIDTHKEVVIPHLGVTARHLMQHSGDSYRAIRETWWIEVLEDRLNEIKRGLGDDLCVVVSDVRYINEAFWFRQRGQLWHITRPDQDPSQTRSHSSEAGIVPLGGEALIQNTGTLADLFAHVDRLLTP